MDIGKKDVFKIYTRRESDGEIVSEISDTVEEATDGFYLEIILTCEAVEE